ncbi:hypothetical protein EV121DRAFT_292735 [Schizophyllum commune]
MGISGAKTASKEFRASIKEAIRLIKAGGLQRLLYAPPDKAIAEFLGDLGCNEVCTQLYTLAMLADIVRRGHPALWVLPDPMDLYPRAFRWISYLLPLKRGFSTEYRSANRDIMLELLDGSIGIFQHILSLPSDRARSALLSEGHDAIGDISLWKALGQTDDDNALIATFFLRAVSHKPTRLFKFIERQLHEANLRLACDDDSAWADATSFVIISTLLLLYRDLSVELFSAHAAMSDFVRQSSVLPEEKELRELAERRQTLLQVASQDWKANVRCCNPNCSYAPEARLRG